MDSKTIKEKFTELQRHAVEVERNNAYFEGRNPSIIKEPVEKKPDNRIPTPLAKMSVEEMAGYAGKYGAITTVYTKVDGEDSEDSFIDYCRAMNEYNEEKLETSELYEESLIQGNSYEIFWISDEMDLPSGLMTTEFKIVPTASVYLEWSNDIKKKLLYGIHYSGDKEEMTATVYYPYINQTWVSKAGGEYSLVEEFETPFSIVPINPFASNRRGHSLFQAEKTQIDAFDKLLSKTVNEVDRFNSSILLLADKVDKQFVYDVVNNLVDVIDDQAFEENKGGFPKYLTKELGGIDSLVNSLLDRIEDLYRKSVKTIDMTSEQFAGAQSGLAMIMKLIGMEFKAAQIETYFNKGLKRRIKYFADVYNASTLSVDINDYKVTIDSKRNVPADEKAKVEIAQMLMGLVSEETLLKILPNTIVDDVKKEMERKAAEMPANVLELDEPDEKEEEQDK